MLNWNFGTQSIQPIGLDIGHDAVKMIQLAASDEGITVLAAQKARIDPNMSDNGEERRRFIVLTLKQMLSQGDFRGRDVVSSLPSEKVNITSVRVADAETAQVEQILKKEAAQRFGLDPAKDTIRYTPAGTVRQGDDVKNEFILFAVADETVKAHITMLEEAGLRPVGLDVSPCALFRTFERQMRRQEDKERTIIFIDIGHLTTTVVFSRATELCFVKQVPIGGDNFNREVAARLGLTPADAEMLRIKLQRDNLLNTQSSAQPLDMSQASQDDQSAAPQQRAPANGFDPATRQIMVDAISSVADELAKEISLCSRYYTVTFRGKRIERAVITGGAAYENILIDVLRRNLAVEVEIAEPLRGFTVTNPDFDSFRPDVACEWAVAVGLSLKGSEGAAKIFRPGSRQDGKQVQPAEGGVLTT